MFEKDPKNDLHHGEQTPEKSAQLGRRRFLRKTGFIAGVASFASALSLTPFSPAHAATHSSGTPIELPKATAEGYIRKAIVSHDYQLFRANLQQEEYVGILMPQEHEASAIMLSDHVIVRVPVAGGAGFSGFGAVFQQTTGTLVSTLGSLNLITPERNVHVVLFQNGKIEQNMVLSLDGAIVSANSREFVQGQVIPQDYNQFVACFRRCLDSAGISGWIVALVIAACNVLCNWSAPACIACNAGYYVYLGARGLACAYSCSDKFL